MNTSSSPLNLRKAGAAPLSLWLGMPLLLLCITANSCAGSSLPLPDRTNGVAEGPDKFYCFRGYKRCMSGIRQCIKREQECDSIKDCADGSDEGHHCKTFDCRALRSIKCPSGRMCMNTTSIADDRGYVSDRQFLCDGVKDCADGSDEAPSFCASYDCNSDVSEQVSGYQPPHRRRCPGGKGGCVNEANLCDGVVDCMGDGGSDESDRYCKMRGCSRTYLTSLFQCRSGRCIKDERVCDGKRDCPDGDDEGQLCEEKPCPYVRVKCSGGTNRTCILETQVCDGVEDCPGGTDEKQCNSSSSCRGYRSYLCPSGKQCALFRQCDGVKECRDGSDEDPELCRTYSCPNDDVKCKDGVTCISRTKVCDGHKDCPDKSDEDPKLCRKYNCSFGEVKCKDGVTCIKHSDLCDGVKNCPDKSDEDPVFCRTRHNCAWPMDPYYKNYYPRVRCPGSAYVWCANVNHLCDGNPQDCYESEDENPKFCSSNTTRNLLAANGRITCRSNTTIFISGYYCDGIENCLDKSDERHGLCKGYKCPPGRVRCYGKWCVTGNRCDGRRDCPDGSDEKGCSS